MSDIFASLASSGRDLATDRLRPMTPDEEEAQRRSFAFGNTVLTNPLITRQMVDEIADRMAQEPDIRPHDPPCCVLHYPGAVAFRFDFRTTTYGMFFTHEIKIDRGLWLMMTPDERKWEFLEQAAREADRRAPRNRNTVIAGFNAFAVSFDWRTEPGE